MDIRGLGLLLIMTAACCAVEQSIVRQAETLLARGAYAEADQLFESVDPGNRDDHDDSLAYFNNLRAACHYRMLRPAKAREMWELSDKQAVGLERVGKAIWINRVIFALDMLNVPHVEALIAAHPDDPLSKVANNAISVWTGMAKGIVGNPSASSIDLMLTLEANRLSGVEAIPQVKLTMVGTTVRVNDAPVSLRDDEVAQAALFLGRIDLAEELLRAQVQREAGAAPQHPRSDKALLRLARVYVAKKEFFLADAMIRDADAFVVKIYGEDSFLRVWPIEEKVRLYRLVGRNGEAESLAQSASAKYPDFRARFYSHGEKFEVLP